MSPRIFKPGDKASRQELKTNGWLETGQMDGNLEIWSKNDQRMLYSSKNQKIYNVFSVTE